MWSALYKYTAGTQANSKSPSSNQPHNSRRGGKVEEVVQKLLFVRELRIYSIQLKFLCFQELTVEIAVTREICPQTLVKSIIEGRE